MIIPLPFLGQNLTKKNPHKGHFKATGISGKGTKIRHNSTSFSSLKDEECEIFETHMHFSCAYVQNIPMPPSLQVSNSVFLLSWLKNNFRNDTLLCHLPHFSSAPTLGT